MPEISVIVPVYNSEEYLIKCMDSILCQTLKDIEVVLINDGSVDKSGEICNEYARLDSRVKVIHQENCGLPAARTTGINNSSGKFITFVDSDDYIKPDLFEKMYKDMKQNCCDLVAYNSYYVDNGQKVYLIKTKYNGIYYQDDIFSILKNIIDYDYSKEVFFASVWSKLFIKDIITKNNINYKNNLVTISDTLFLIEYLFYCKSIYCSNIPYYYYVMSTESNSRKNINISKKWSNFRLYLKELILVIQESKFNELLPAAYSTYLTCMNTTLIFASKDQTVKYHHRRQNAIKILKDIEFREVVDKIKFWQLNKLKKKFYIVQKYYLVDLIFAKELVKNIFRRIFKK